jgi:DNA-directed RNA polymerase II subunit RPB2
MLTRQPLEGRARDGGLRFGEMERDAMIGHGTVNFLKERFYESSDKYEIFLCDSCGHIAIGNPAESIYKCQSCSKVAPLSMPISNSLISKVQIPYSAKLLIHEIIAMGVSVRMFTENYSGD